MRTTFPPTTQSPLARFRHRLPLRFEALEDRATPAVTATLSASGVEQITIDNSNGVQSATVSNDGTNVRVTDANGTVVDTEPTGKVKGFSVQGNKINPAGLLNAVVTFTDSYAGLTGGLNTGVGVTTNLKLAAAGIGGGSNFDFNGPVILQSDTKMDTGGGPLFFNDTVNGPFALNVKTEGGGVQFAKGLGTSTALTSFSTDNSAVRIASGLQVAINGPNPGAASNGYTQLAFGTGVENVSGQLAINRLPGFVPKVGDAFTIIKNPGDTGGTSSIAFDNLAEGATVKINGVTYQITYKGGTSGKDTVLTVVAVDATLGGTSSGTFQPGTNQLEVSGNDGEVNTYTFSGGQAQAKEEGFTPFPGVQGVVRSTAADVDGDGVADTIYVTGPGNGGSGGGDEIRIISGKDGSDLISGGVFHAFPGEQFGPIGMFVAAGDIDGDGKAEVVVSPDVGGGARIQIFDLVNGQMVQRANFFGIDDLNFRGGARIALGDVNGDGKLDLVVGAGFQGGPRVAIFDGAQLLGGGTPGKLVPDFFAFPGADAVNLRNGVFVSAGDIDGDGKADLVFGGGPGGAPRVFVLSGAQVLQDVNAAQNNPLANFFVAGDTASRGGVRTAVKDIDGDNKLDVVVGSGENLPSAVRDYLGKNFPATNGTEPALNQQFDPFGVSSLVPGVFVG